MSRFLMVLALAVALGLGLLVGVISNSGSSGSRTVRTTVARTRTVTVGDRARRVSPAARLPRLVRLGIGAPEPHLQALIPADAVALNSWTLPAGGGTPEQLAVTWARGPRPGDDYNDYALVIWQRYGGPGDAVSWRRVYSLDAGPVTRNDQLQVQDIAAQVADVTGDGHPDALVFRSVGGSGGCGVYDLLATVARRVRDLYSSELCLDGAVAALRPNALVIDRGFVLAPHMRGYAHPIYRSWKRTVERWNGHALAPVSSHTIKPSQRVSGPYGR